VDRGLALVGGEAEPVPGFPGDGDEFDVFNALESLFFFHGTSVSFLVVWGIKKEPEC
jgi:hypothetical protein